MTLNQVEELIKDLLSEFHKFEFKLEDDVSIDKSEGLI